MAEFSIVVFATIRKFESCEIAMYMYIAATICICLHKLYSGILTTKMGL